MPPLFLSPINLLTCNSRSVCCETARAALHHRRKGTHVLHLLPRSPQRLLPIPSFLYPALFSYKHTQILGLSDVRDHHRNKHEKMDFNDIKFLYIRR